eukprot:3763904-Rhodomonas_salina.2
MAKFVLELAEEEGRLRVTKRRATLGVVRCASLGVPTRTRVLADRGAVKRRGRKIKTCMT